MLRTPANVSKHFALGAVLLCLWQCTDAAVVGYNCPIEGCDAGAPDPCMAFSTTVTGINEVCCQNDAECMLVDDAPRCHPQKHRCVQCLKDSDCDVDEPFCVEHACTKCRDGDGECQDSHGH